MFKVFIYLKEHFQDYRKYYISGIIFLLLSTMISLVPAQIISYFVNLLTNNNLNVENFLMLVMIMVAVIIVGYIIGSLWIYLLFIPGEYYSFNKRKAIHTKILGVKNNFFFKYPVGDVITRMTSDLKSATSVASDGVYFSVEALSSLILIVIAMTLTTNFTMSMIVVIPMLILSVLTNRLSNIVSKHYDKIQASTSDLSNLALQSISGIRIVNAFNMQEETKQQLDKQAKLIYNKACRLDYLDSLMGPLYRISYGIIYTLAIGYGLYLVSEQIISVGQLVAFNIYIGMLDWPINALQLVFGILQRGNTSLRRLNEISSEQEQQEEGEIEISHIRQITFEKFNFGYEQAQLILKDVNLDIKQGSKLGIVGKIGSGKSTLIKQLLNLYALDYTGNIFINDINLFKINRKHYLNQVAYVAQEAQAFAMSIKDNVLIGNAHASEKEVIKALQHACLYEDVLGFSDGINTLVNEKGISLSGGQQQRLALARALVRRSSLLILDDILSALDLETERKIINNLNEYYQDKTIILISHRLSCIIQCDNIVVLEQGQIIEQGYHEQLLKKDGWYAKQYWLQIESGDNDEF